jgi:hypothetical protein
MKLIIAFVIAISSAPVCNALPITLVHQGVGSGTLGGISFTETPFVITALANTADRVFYGHGVIELKHKSTNVAIDGLGSFSFITSSSTLVDLNNANVGFAEYGLFKAQLIFGPSDPAFTTWYLDTSIGPYSSVGEIAQWEYGTMNTSGGVLIFEENGFANLTFSAMIPEPNSICLVGCLLPLAFHRRR